GGKIESASWKLCRASPICLRLLTHWMRLAASRADWTAGSNRAISTAMIAVTTRSSIRVKPRHRFITDLLQDKPRLTARFDLIKQNPRLAVSMPHLLSESLLVC